MLFGAVAVLAPLPAVATTTGKSDSVPCWKRLLNDYYDGQLNSTYPIPCYTEAIKHLPASLEIYGSAKEDIIAARTAAINHKPPPPEGGSGGSTTTVAAGSSSGGGGGVSSFPLPVLILGGVAILLVIAGGIGMLWQRSHPRDDDAAGA